MWKDPDPDPGGEPPESPSKFSRQLSDLKDENEQQKVLIFQLKEMLRKEQSNVSQEKIDEYVNTLKKMTAKKSRVKKGESSSTEKHVTIDTSKTGKLNLLKQQLEQNKARLAERGKNQKGIEDMVTQLQADLNDSQQLINSGPISLIDPKALEYSKSSNPEELYNILVMKEQKITELMTRTQKQEAKILDLQENLKEKDSVIDARTKAITLMTDSLSKKGKSTLDALDERKEQMRKMQEDFVNYENDMKARQVKLLEDLKAKNLEIQELKETNEKLLKEYQEKEESKTQNLDDSKGLQVQLESLKQENEEYLGKISELEHQLQESVKDIKRLENIVATTEKLSSNDDEINKLKKQLEDSNKNMIKMKAQSKSKIKDLTKKLEAFKKMSDVNALVAELQNQNTKLSEKVAELEEEKGNLQLNMVESSDSIKDSGLMDENKQLQDRISQHLDELNDKDKVISLLEADIIALKEQITTLNSQISNLSHLENAQVTSEMNSIQIEEQLDQLETENTKLKEEIEDLQKQNRELTDKIEGITKEKQEINAKLESYIQENMDLIDKLEKLSAEKVSSAESIEIVEGLTQQEKNELAAYQKTLDVRLGEPIKIVEDPDDTLEAPPELNESVHQLTEDSADLLQKIEMFNAERKEVMLKMEALKEENNNLSLRVQEIENNRDMLADTYEQLQTEKEDILKEKEDLELKLKQLESSRSENKTTVPQDNDVSSQLHALQAKYERMLEENESLKTTIKDFDVIIHEKHELESHLTEFRNRAEQFEAKLQDSVQEITNYEAIIEENKNELIGSANTINNLEAKLKDRENEIKELNILINDMNNIVNNLQAENEKIGNFEIMETKFEELKTALNTQIEQAQDYAEEIEHNKDVITDLNKKLEDMHRKILDTEHEIETKDIEMEKMKQELINRDDMIKNLQAYIQDKDEKLKLVSSEMKDKYLALQKQLDGNNGSLEKQIADLNAKNKEQLEKMKKIAANLKKKNQAYQELDEKYHGEKEKWETELKEKETLISQVKDLKEEVDQKTSKLEECEIRIRELTDVVQNLEQDLENSMIEMRRKQEKLNEVSLKQELSTSLHEEFDEEHSTNVLTNDGKIRELELIIETNESEISHYKERLQKLEEELEKTLEDREQMEVKVASLENQLSLVSKNMEEKAMLEEELGQQLKQVSANDELLVKKLEESDAEVKELTQKTKEQEELITKLKVKLKKAHEKVTQLKSSQQALEELEAANNELKKQLVHLESVHKHTQEDNELLQRRNQSEYEKIENDYQIQLEELVKVRNELMIECEKLREDVKTYKERGDELSEEIAELKSKTEEADRLSSEVEELSRKLAEETTSKNETIKELELMTNTLQSYKFEIHELENQMLQQTAKETVEEIVELAADKIVSINTKETQTEFEDNEIPNMRAVDAVKQDVIPTFNWPGPNEGFIEQPFVHVQTPAVAATAQPAFLSDIESQILSSADIVDAANNKQALQEIEFEKVHPSFGDQSQPVVEMIKPKQAYLTFQPGTEAFGENDDGWGWGPEESKLEEEHQNLASSTSQVQNLKTQLAQVNEQLLVLQMERENHLEEIKQLQVKSGKLIKKCKELKIRNDQLVAQKAGKKSADEFFDLNDAIQEELKSQIAQLEKKIKEITTELDKEKSEKKSILNRVDVLTAANERMVEMKEIQDSEVLRWKRKYEETEEKLQQQDWGSDGFRERPPPKQPEEDSQTIEELQRTIKELSLDNEELQSLLNEQRDLRIQAEKFKTLDIPTIPPELEKKIKLLEHELNIRNGEIQAVLAEKSNLIDSLQVSLSQKESVISSLEEELMETTQQLEESNVMLKNLRTSCDLIRSEFEEKARACQSLKNSFDQLSSVGDSLMELKKCLEELKQEKIMLETVLNEKDNQLRDVYTQINSDTSSSEIEELRYKLQESDTQKAQLQSNILQLMFDLELASSKLLEAEQSKAGLEKLIKDKESELENLKSSYDSWGSKYKEEVAEDDYKAHLEALITENDVALNQNKAAYDQIMGLNDSLTKQNEILGQDMEELKQTVQETLNHLQLKKSRTVEVLEKTIEEMKQQRNSSEEDKVLEELTALKTQKQDMEELKKKISDLEEENKTLQETLNHLQLKKSRTVEVLEETIEEMKQQMNSSEEDKVLEELTALKTQKQETDAELERLRLALDEKQREFEVVIAELEAKWAVQVDERGNTVAESWKYHLNMVEAEFAAVQEKLKNEISELEEKCNLLVNENNELRKNVDAEIKNEVDRISALQHQINEKQQAINDLTLRLSQEQHESNQMKEKLANMGDVAEKEKEMKRLKFVLETTQQQFEEKRGVLEEIVKALENYSPNPITLQREDILSNFNRQLMKNAEYEQEIHQLRIQIDDFKNTSDLVKEAETEITNLKETIEHLQQQLQEKEQEINRLAVDVGNLQSVQNVTQDKEAEVFRLNELVGNLQGQLDSVFEKDAEISNLKQSVSSLQGQLAILSQKDQEIVTLQQTIEDYKEQINQLRQNYSMLQEEKSSLTYYIEDHKRQLDESLQSHTTLQNTIDQQNQQILTLNQHLQQYETYRNDTNQVVEHLHKEIAQLKENCEVSQKSLTECQQQLFATMQELSDKTNALNDVSQQLNTAQQNVEIFESEMLQLRQRLDLKERDYADSIETLKKSRFAEVETHYEEVLAAKELDLEKAKAQLQEALQQNSLLSENLKVETRVKAELEVRIKELEEKILRSEEKLTEQLKLMEEEEKQLEEMRGIIEEQVVKIEELKKELFEKSNYYDSLIAEMDIGKKNVVQQQAVQRAESAASTSKPQEQDPDLTDPVSRAELDLALYMLHQSDVRCEELMVELTQLLEERDTLQLRLSNAIREKEELRRKHGGPSDAVAPPPDASSQDPSTPTRSRSSQIFLAASGAELATEASETLGGEQDLATKLSELKMVGYKKDKTFVDEQQLRRLQQMSIMQQHLKEAAKLPPEAAAKLVDASYTLSRDVQSPSKVILNWLWGRSTPRQNDI